LLSSKGDEKADFTALNRLPKVTLSFTASPIIRENGKYRVIVEVNNPSSSLAFSLNPKILKRGSHDMVLPVRWEDNYFSLLPKEKRTISVEFDPADLNGEAPLLVIDGRNIFNAEKDLN